jgi:hypothetical protein
MYCLCVNVYCHRVSTQLQLTNISISIFFALLATSSDNYSRHQANIAQKLGMSVCPSVPPRETSWLSRGGLLWNLIFYCFWKICRENWNVTRMADTSHEDRYVYIFDHMSFKSPFNEKWLRLKLERKATQVFSNFFFRSRSQWPRDLRREIASSNPAGSMVVCLLWVLCVVR